MGNDTAGRKSKIFFIGSIAAFVLFVVLIALFVDVQKVRAWAEGLNPWAVFAMLVFLPLVGFPVSVLFVVTGVKFGPGWGLAVVGIGIALHLLITYWVTSKILHDPIERLFKKTKYKMPRIPEGEQVSISLLTALVPGIPYFAKNYLLVLGKVPFKPYFLSCWPSHVFHASLAILFGGMSKELTPTKGAFLLVYAVVVTWLCRRVIKSLKARRTMTEASEAE